MKEKRNEKEKKREKAKAFEIKGIVVDAINDFDDRGDGNFSLFVIRNRINKQRV